MAKQFIIRILLVALSAGNATLFVSCHNSVDPNDIPKLYIENGFYNIVPSTEASVSKCAVQFEYFVKGQQCQVGGYAIRCDSTSWVMNWYRLKTLAPETRYTMTDTLRSTLALTTNPTVTMQGYRIGDAQSSPEIKVQYVLVRKPL